MSYDFEFKFSADEVETIILGLDRYIQDVQDDAEAWQEAEDIWEILQEGSGKFTLSDIQVDIVLNSLDYVDRAAALFCRIFNERNEQCLVEA